MKRGTWILLVLACAVGLRAADEGDAGQPAAFLKLGVGGRELAMGRIAAPDRGDAFAFSYNPAYLAALDTQVLGSQTSFLAGDRSLDHFSYARPFELFDQSLAGGLTYTHFGLNAPIEVRVGNTPEPDSTFTASQSALQLSLATWQFGSFGFGLNARWLDQQLGQGLQGYGYAFDLGSLWRISRKVELGLVLQDLIGSMRWSSSRVEPLAPALRSTLTLKPRRDLVVCAELEKNLEQDPRFRGGVEWWLPGAFMALRAGMNHDAWSLGAGFRAEPWGWSSALDWSLSRDPLEPGALAQRLSLSVELPTAEDKKDPS
ncbi:MAG: hypothetical protein V4498_02715 [candidate division FCPU426 bacterium]